MRRLRLHRQLFISYLLITLVALLAVTWGTWWTLREFYFTQTRQDLEARAHIAAALVAGHLRLDDTAVVDARCKEAGQRAGTRLTVILPSGKVIGDSDHDVSSMENHSGRPEVQQALHGVTGVAIRDSATVHHSMMYTAVPVFDGSRVIGVVRASIPLTAYNTALDRLHIHLLFEVLLIALAAAIISLFIARRVSRPLEQARRAAARFARGELQERLPVTGSEEIAGLAETMNQMAAQLDERIRTIVRQRTEQEAVLYSMIEGVLAVDQDERIIKLNTAGASLLGLDPEQAHGRSIQETVRNSELQRFIAAVLANPEEQEAEIVLRLAGEPQWLQLHGTLLHDEEGRRIGALVVITDVTRLHRLETVRQDFVANVSHELRTPIASIKASAETLLDGALANPEDAERFLRIIARHTDRMHAIIEDLLVLSRLEQQGVETGIPLEETPLKQVLDGALQTCQPHAVEQEISLSLTGDPSITAIVNPALLEQAVVNLIDNAIKYSAPDSPVIVEAVRAETETLIHVRDQGWGIASEHLPRLFERFYRVDTSRSRKLGGTGLGLAIVKHIIQAHQGQVTVESHPGQGSTFTIHLPHHEQKNNSL